MKAPRSRFSLPFLVVVSIMAADASAQTSRPQHGPTGDRDPAGLLAGPRVHDDAVGSARDDQVRDRLPSRVWFATARALDLDEVQRRSIDAIIAEMGRARRAFQRTHGAELRRLRDRVRAARSTDAPPARALVERLRELEGLAPKAPSYQTGVWDELTAAQRVAMLEELSRRRAERASRRQAMTDGARDAPEAAPPARPGPDLDAAAERRLRFLLEHRRGADAPPS